MNDSVASSKLEVVSRIIEERIESGAWPVGSQIPIEVDLARELQCSRSTVGKAIARLVHDGVVQRRTRAGTWIVKPVATQPKVFKRTLALDACALIYPSDKNEGLKRISQGFQAAAHQTRRRIVTLSTGVDFRQEAEIVGRLGEFDVEGAVLLPVIVEPEDFVYFAKMILACPFPVVLVEQGLPALRRPEVVLDGFHAGYTMTKQVLSRGRRRVGFFANYASSPVVRDKFLGYRQALEDGGLEPVQDLICMDPRMHPNFGDPIAEPYQLAKSYLARSGLVDAVVCATDFLALGLVKAAKEVGRSVPSDLAVTGMNDMSVAATSEVPLTTYRVPFEAMGAEAFRILAELLDGKPSPVVNLQLRGSLIVRQSG